MRKRLMFIVPILTGICLTLHIHSAQARGISAVELNTIPTAETLGKDGYSLSLGMIQYKLPATSVSMDVGKFFRKAHQVRFEEGKIWFVPSRITYGISDRLDFVFGGTYAAGDADKIIDDYYGTGDEEKDKRVYSQVVFDGIVGAKYNMQQPSGRIPALAIGGEVQMGYTVDDEFVDTTLEDSMPFVAMLLYLAASYDFEIVNAHGGLGMFVSSKSIQSTNNFDVPVQAGVEIPFDGIAVVLDVALFKAFSGVNLGETISVGLRYDISSRATLNATIASAGGFLVRLTVGGSKGKITAPPSAPTLF